MVTLENYVDGDIPRWNLGDDEPLGVDVSAVVVFHPDIKPRIFERAVKALEARRRARIDMTLKHARPTRSHLRVIDAETLAAAALSCDETFGYDYLDRFISDTLEVAAEEVGHAVSKARLRGVLVTPEHYTRGITVIPTRSFADRAALDVWERGGRSKWRPSTRLQVNLSLDGPLAAVEASSEDLRRAISICGPLTFFEEHARISSEITYDDRLLLLVAAEPEVCA
ncbi:hypothetical protein G6L37_01430 [Agrobacterium rubi]|nr:hypothetical protein [Agrobacterium rubi]NTF24054.1 hypothetical protein [Agrobacterium rubi]